MHNQIITLRLNYLHIFVKLSILEKVNNMQAVQAETK